MLILFFNNGQFKFHCICCIKELNSIIKLLKQLKPELIDKYHASSIGLFGSVVREDFNSVSDIDIIVDFSQPIGIGFIDLAEFLEKKLKKSVDLVSKNGVKQKYYHLFVSEIIYV